MYKIIASILVIANLLFTYHLHGQDKPVDAEDFSSFKQMLMNGQSYEKKSSNNDSFNYSREKSTKGSRDFGDTPSWNNVDQFGGSANDYGNDVVSDNNGNIYMTGSFSGEMELGGYSYNSLGERDVIVAKFDPSGTMIWIKHFFSGGGDNMDARGICLDDQGNVFITGYYTGSANIGPYTLPPYGDKNMYFAKLNSSGGVLMVNDPSVIVKDLIGQKIKIDNTGNVYVLTYEYSHYGFPGRILKFNSSGVFIDQYNSEEHLSDFDIVDESIYCAGIILYDGFVGEYFFDASWHDAFIAKSDLSFNFDWAYMGEHDQGYSTSYSLFVDQDKKIYMTGYSSNDISFGALQTGGVGGFVVKCIDPENFIWISKITDEPIGNSVYDFSIDGSNSFVYTNLDKSIIEFNAVTGEQIAVNELDYRIGKLAYNLSDNSISITGNNNGLIYVSKIDSNLNEDWLIQSEGDSGFGHIIGMETDHTGNFFAYGYASAAMDYFGELIQRGTFLSKQKPDGEIIWIKQFVGVFQDYGYGSYITSDPSNENVFITGELSDTLTIPGGPTLVPGNEGSYFILKYGIDGTYKFAVKEDFNSDYWGGLCLATDYAGNIIISGTFQETINISGTELISAGSNDAFIAKYNTSGGFLWAIRAGGEEIEYSGLISVDANDNIYFTGEFCSENVTISNTQITMEEGDGNIIFAKLAPGGMVQ